LAQASVEIGHVGIVRALMDAAALNDNQQAELFELLQRKAQAEMRSWVAANVKDSVLATILCGLPGMAGDRSSLATARKQLNQAPPSVLTAVSELETLAGTLQQRFPKAQLVFDLSEPHSFAYHTGIVFSAFAPGYGRALASGGRYDHIGEVFGRARPATGFSLDVTALTQLLNAADDNQSQGNKPAIFVEVNDDPEQWNAICALRAEGEVVINGFACDEKSRKELNCNRQLQLIDGVYQVVTAK